MVEFNKLLVIPCNKGLYLDISIPDMSYYTNVYLNKIVIDTQDTYTDKGISTAPIYSYDITGNLKSIKLSIDSCDFSIPQSEGTMYFVYVQTIGEFATDTPCGMENPLTLKVAVDTYYINKIGLKYIRECYSACNIPRYLMDFILRYKAFLLCLDTYNYPMAITYWHKFLKGMKKISPNCGCHGQISI